MPATSFGGYPVKNSAEAFTWPACAYCHLPMQFLGKIAHEAHLYQIFMCQNDPGVCEEWDPNDGGNKIIVTQPEQLEYVSAPADGECLREIEHSASLVAVESNSYEDARNLWAEQNKQELRMVLGQMGSAPMWVQGDATPLCDSCQQPMRFLAQLEEGPERKTAMNFGSGCAYVFNCDCNHSGKFLWQC
ncbi:MAG TPA: hypothetical protein VN030_06080 [Cellvibrio sp.]|nr:hypothetical protein [Cellvibrio sp.]